MRESGLDTGGFSGKEARFSASVLNVSHLPPQDDRGRVSQPELGSVSENERIATTATRRRAIALGIAFILAFVVFPGCEGMDLGWGPDLERMIQQNKVDPYEESPVFPDRSSMRMPPRDTVPMERELNVTMRRSGYPVALSRELLELGRTRYDVYCGVCHGLLGDAASPVASNMQLRPPPSIHEPHIVSMSNRMLHDVVVNGYGIMPGYSMQLSFEEQWAVVAYIRALQVSRSVPIVDLPAAVRQQLEQMP